MYMKKLVSMLVCLLMIVMMAVPAMAETFAAKVVQSENLNLTDLECEFNLGTLPDNKQAIGSIIVTATVTGPSEITDMLIGSWGLYQPEKDFIQQQMESHSEMWKGQIEPSTEEPPFFSGNRFPVYEDMLGTELYVLMLGLDQNVDVKGYAVLKMNVPDGSSKTAIKLNKTKATVKKGKTVQLKVSGADKVKWTTSDKKIATVSKNGKVKGKKKGICVITCTAADGATAECKITVK